MGPIPKRRTERAPQIDKYLKPAIGVGLAFFVYIALQGLSSEIPRIDVEDELLLREIFFGEGGSGKNYAILCHNNSPDIPISSVFLDARNGPTDSIPNGLEFGVVDCEHVLPTSGKTIAQRFGLKMKQRPTIFVSGRIGAPNQLPSKHLKTGNMLLKALRSLLEPHTVKIDNTKSLKTKCLGKEYCAVLLKGEKTPEKFVKDAIQNLIVQYPQIQFASLDASVLLLTNLEEHLEIYTKGVHQFIIFKKVSGSFNTETEDKNNKNNSTGRVVTSVATFEGNTSNFKYSALNTFISDAVRGNTVFKKIPALPSVKTRTKKLEEAERKKRERLYQRKTNTQEKKQEEQTGFFDNKDERKADRERLRDEHNKKNNVKELTPEEIKEKEKARRKRMEEEAAKWNMMPEDAPEMGDLVEDEEPLDLDEDDEEVLDMDEDDEEVLDMDEDDDQVMDLD